MTTADEWLARWRDTWHKIAASEFAGETVYSHEAFGVVLAALADAETRAARDAARLAAADEWIAQFTPLLVANCPGIQCKMVGACCYSKCHAVKVLAATPRPDAGQGEG